MLYITLGEVESKKIEESNDVIIYPGPWFDDDYEVSWLNNQMAKDIIMGIDKSEHVKDHLIISPVLGGISPQQLSTGCKATLYMLNNPGTYIRGERFGDNCFYWLGKIGELQDIHITLCHYLDDDVDLIATITNTGVVIHNSHELNKELLEADIKDIEDRQENNREQ